MMLLISVDFADDSKISEMLLFIASVSEVIGDERRKKVKALALAGDQRVVAAMLEHRGTGSSAFLVETLDLILSA
jgi:hypothetical protein